VKVLVTGGAGFIGSHLVDRLIDLKHEVSVIDNLSTGNKDNINKKAKFFEIDINDDLSEVFKDGFDCVFHVAAQVNLRTSLEYPIEDARINILGSLNVINECVKNKVKKIVFSSSGGAIYSEKNSFPCDERGLKNPLSPYGLGKLTIENYLRIFNNIHDLDFVCLRYSNVYGPRQDAEGEAGVVSIFINSILDGNNLNVFGDGEQTRDYVYVKDVVEANIRAINMMGNFNVSTGIETSVNSLAEEIKKLMNSNVEIVHKEAIKGELRKNSLNSNKLARSGWSSAHNLNFGLKETIKWFKR